MSFVGHKILFWETCLVWVGRSFDLSVWHFISTSELKIYPKCSALSIIAWLSQIWILFNSQHVHMLALYFFFSDVLTRQYLWNLK